jgi:hypothetical protein
MSKSIYQKIGIASLIMMASVFLSRFFGLFRLMAKSYPGQRVSFNHVYPDFFPVPFTESGRARLASIFNHIYLLWRARLASIFNHIYLLWQPSINFHCHRPCLCP